MGYQSGTRSDGFCIMKLGIELIVIDLLWHMTCVMYPMTYCIRYMGIEKSTMQQVLLMLKKVEFYAFRKKKKIIVFYVVGVLLRERQREN